MATATKQLEAIYQEITLQFAENRFITVTPLDGDPPEKYEITYRITGIYRDDSGEIQEKDSHIVTISIPFGFPHFPPSCKPKTAIFHPDFDPAAICIGDFWEKERTIGDLILHIGQMIAGHVFSTSNAFNEEAAKWYKDNSHRLPFDQQDLTLESKDDEALEWAPGHTDNDDVTLLLDDDNDTEPEVPTPFEPVEEAGEQPEPSSRDRRTPSVDQQEDSGIDTLDDSFLETDFDYFGAESRDPDTDDLVPPRLEDEEEDHPITPDIDRFKLLAKQKRFYELNNDLSALPGDQTFGERDRLAQQAAMALQQARELYNQGTDFEHQGDPGRACESFKQVEKVVSDYPGLPEDIERTAQAKELLGDWFDSSADQTADKDVSFDAEGAADTAIVEKKSPPKKSDTRTFFEDTARQSSKLIPYAIGIVVLITFVSAAVSFYLNSSRLDSARKKLADCQAVLNQNRFTEAERQCEQALDIAKQVQFFRSGTRDNLIDEIETVLKSEVLHEGLAGNLYHEGRYLPRQVVRAEQAFRQFMNQGDAFFANEDWQQALARYDQALNLAAQEQEIDQDLVFTAREKQKTARFNTLFRSGNEFISREKWVLATDDLEQALTLARELNIENKAEVIASLTAKLDEISVATAKEQGDLAFAEEQWSIALDHYKEAHTVAMESARPADPLVDELKQLVVKAELYETINTAKNAFTAADWDKAIANYERAISILESNSDLLKQSNTDGNKKKLAKTMLQAAIIRDKQEAARHLKEQNYRTAIEKLHSIIATINRSEFKEDQEFDAVLKETAEAVQQAETDLLLADKIVYLEENFKELFTKHYTASPPESLVDPAVFYEKQLGNRLLFRLECTEIGRGRPLKLVMKYTHNLNTGEWQFYSGNE